MTVAELVTNADAARAAAARSRRAREIVRGGRRGRACRAVPVAAPVSGVEQGQLLPDHLAGAERVTVTYEIDGAPESLVYFGVPGALAAYEELRTGFTAAVSHELRTPLARLLVLLESADLPGSDVPALIERARGEVNQVQRAHRRGPLPQPARDRAGGGRPR